MISVRSGFLTGMTAKKSKSKDKCKGNSRSFAVLRMTRLMGVLERATARAKAREREADSLSVVTAEKGKMNKQAEICESHPGTR